MMNITQAKAAMRKLLGEKAAWRYNERAPKADEREELQAALPALQAARTAAKDAAEARRVELLNNDPEYQRLFVAWREAEKATSEALSRTRSRRVTILKNTGVFNLVVAEGDNWQDAIDKLRARAKNQL